MDRREREYMSVELEAELPAVERQELFKKPLWCGIRSQDLIERASLALAMFFSSLVRESAKFAAITC